MGVRQISLSYKRISEWKGVLEGVLNKIG
jgi:hypothetical protein